MTDSTDELCSLLDKAAVVEYTKTADVLDALWNRLGRDGLSMEEWNALCGAVHFMRIEAARRNTRPALSSPAPDAVEDAMEDVFKAGADWRWEGDEPYLVAQDKAIQAAIASMGAEHGNS